MNLLTLCFPFLLFIHNAVNFRDNGASENYVHILNCVVNDYVEMLEEENDIHLVNKVGVMCNKIHFLGLHFASYKSIDQNTGRKMMLQLIDSFLERLNSNKRLRPFLCPFPFTENNIELRISFRNDCLYPYPQPDTIQYMVFMNGTTTFYGENPRSLGTLEILREEPLEFSRLAENLPHRSSPRLGPKKIPIEIDCPPYR